MLGAKHISIVTISVGIDHKRMTLGGIWRITHNYEWGENQLIPDYTGFVTIMPLVTNQLCNIQ